MSTEKEELPNQNDPVQNGVSVISNGKTTTNGRQVSFTNDLPTSSTTYNTGPRPSFVETYTSRRWNITFLALIVLTLNVTLRMGMNFALVCMVKPMGAVGNYSDNNQSDSTTATVNFDEEWVVHWDSSTQGQIISSYQIGFPWLCVFGGWASGRFGGKKILIVMSTICIVVSIAVPISSLYSPYLVMGLRFIVGLAAGGILPCITQILSSWTPIFERSRMIATATSGNLLGTMVSYLTGGILCTVPFQNGWPLIFYIFAGLNLLFLFVWARVVYDHPAEHPKMTEKEIQYIIGGQREMGKVKIPDTPWRQIFTSSAVWAIHSAHMSLAIVFTILTTFMPLYMNDVMKFDTILNGVASSALYIGQIGGTMVCGTIADRLYISGRLSILSIRKLFQSIAMIVSAPFLIGISYLDHTQKELAVALLMVYWFLQGGLAPGFRANFLDIAPRFSGVLSGLTTSSASAAGILGPVITSAIVKEGLRERSWTQNSALEECKQGTREEWQIVFFVCAGTGVVGTIIYLCFAKGHVQPWAQIEETEIVVEVKKRRKSSIFTSLTSKKTSNQTVNKTGDKGAISRSRTYPLLVKEEEQLHISIDLNRQESNMATDNVSYIHDCSDQVSTTQKHVTNTDHVHSTNTHVSNTDHVPSTNNHVSTSDHVPAQNNYATNSDHVSATNKDAANTDHVFSTNNHVTQENDAADLSFEHKNKEKDFKEFEQMTENIDTSFSCQASTIQASDDLSSEKPIIRRGLKLYIPKPQILDSTRL